MEKKYIAIVFSGYNNTMDIFKKHLGETHSSDGWSELADSYEDEDHYSILTQIYQFDTKAEMLAFKLGVERAEYCLDSYNHTVEVLTERISDSANN